MMPLDNNGTLPHPIFKELELKSVLVDHVAETVPFILYYSCESLILLPLRVCHYVIHRSSYLPIRITRKLNTPLYGWICDRRYFSLHYSRMIPTSVVVTLWKLLKMGTKCVWMDRYFINSEFTYEYLERV